MRLDGSEKSDAAPRPGIYPGFPLPHTAPACICPPRREILSVSGQENTALPEATGDWALYRLTLAEPFTPITPAPPAVPHADRGDWYERV